MQGYGTGNDANPVSHYLYDATGRRVAKHVQIVSLSDLWTLYTYDGWRVLEERELSSSDSGYPRLKRQFVYGNYLDEPLAMDVVDSGKRYLYLQNTLFSVTGLVDAAGALVEAYAYDPYGAPVRFAPASGQTAITDFDSTTLTTQVVFNPATPSAVASLFGNPYLFTGQRFDPETGLHSYKERYYDCGLGRFVSRDPIGIDGGINLYEYGISNPGYYADPTGTIPLDTVWDLGNVIWDIAVGDDVALTVDVAALVIPYVPAGATKLIKGSEKLVDAAKVREIAKIDECRKIKSAEVIYEYVEHKSKHIAKKSLLRRPDKLIESTISGPALFYPRSTHADVKIFIQKALDMAKKEGRIKPTELDGLEFDMGVIVGASNGKITNKLKIYVTPQGQIHARPW